jgi:hypothetical protein
VQRDLFRNAVATLAYVGAKGTHLTLQHELNQLAPVPASQNPYQPGQVITNDDCNSISIDPITAQATATANVDTSNPVTMTGSWANNLAVACGNNPDLYRTSFYGFNSIQRIESIANSNYNALQFSLRKTSGALTLDVAYTYSHSLDNSSDNFDSNFVNSYDLHKNYASSNYDQRHILTVSWIYELPFFGRKRLTRTFLGGWQWAGIMTSQSGVPFSVVDGVFGDNAGVADGTTGIGSFADRVGNPHAAPDPSCSVPNTKGALLFNCAAYALPQGLTFGNSGRNSLNQPHRTNFDMSVYKVFKATEKVNVQFRAEAFNIFNHTQWSGLNSAVQTTNFLYATSAHLPRVLQFALRVTF